MKYVFILLLVLPIIGCTQQPQQLHDMTAQIKDNDPKKYRVSKSEDAWKQFLSQEQYHILRLAGTERPFTGKYVYEDQAGIYFSAATGQPLFLADTKFDSGCGWPSFFEPITPDAVYYRTDYSHGMVRTEVIDSGSGSHLGHVFTDGPPPTGLRYCMNSEALLFVSLGKPFPELVRNYMETLATDEEKQLVTALMKK